VVVGLVCADELLVLDPISIFLAFYISQPLSIDREESHKSDSRAGTEVTPPEEDFQWPSFTELFSDVSSEPDAVVGLGIRLGTLRALCALTVRAGLGALPAASRRTRATPGPALRSHHRRKTFSGRVSQSCSRMFQVIVGLVCADELLVLDPISIFLAFYISQPLSIDTYIPCG
jgi:hypothetical protein